MKTKHTPGPWTTQPYAGSDHSIHTDAQSHSADLAIVRDRNGEEGAANARLIAAAPEMLEALEELVAEFDTDAAKAAEEPGCYGLTETGGIEYARAILARIKGTE